MGGDPGGAAEKIVEAVMKKERVGGVVEKALRNFFKADRAVITGVAGSARPAVAAEGFVVEETLPFTDLGGRGFNRYPRRGDETANAARAHVRATAGTSALRDRCMVTLLDDENVAEPGGEVACMGQGIGRG